ncbi:MAG: Rne/Rng family ribonuclease [Actinomycetota bacterium]
MTEEAPDPQAGPAEEGSSESRPRTRRRRRGSRGRGRGSGTARTKPSGEAGSSADGGGAAGTVEKEAAGSAGEPKKKSQAGGRSRSRSRRRPSKPKAAEDGAGKDRAAAETVETDEAGGAVEAEATPATASPDGGSERPASRSRRRRRRRKPAGAGTAQAAAATEAPPAAAQARAPAKPDKAPAKREKREERGRGGPTRTSRAARQGASDRRRRRPQVHAPRRTDKTMLMTEHDERLQIAVVEDRELVEHYVTRTGARSIVGNIYLGKVQNVLPGMEAAFVDVGKGRNAVLYAGEVSYDEDVERGDRRIEQALKAGQSVIVQVTKDPLRGKGARLTAQISLPGRYLVYVPDGGASGISRRVADAERERLRKILKKVRPSEAGVIVRTAAEGASEEDLAADLDRLKKIWEQVRRKARRARAPKTLYEEPDLEERVVRDVFSPAEFKEIVTDSRAVHERVSAYLRDVAPELVDRLRLHDGPLPLFEESHVAEQIHKALERKVWLPSGGYLFIDRVEAMTVIDVNTGKHVGKTNLEETVFGTNVEAAEEIARQLRLRDIGGIIVIDFIDMLFERNRAEVIRTLQEALSRDKTRSQVFDITPLGLLEVTRKKVSAGLLEAFSEPCPTCEGRGILLTHDVT